MPHHHTRSTVDTSSAAVRDALISGAITAATSAAMLAACGKVAEGSAAGPLNGPSQWLWGEHEAYTRRFSVRHTVVGYVIHHAAATMWAGLHEMAVRPKLRPRSVAGHLAAAAATTAVAYVVDYHLTPRRLRPGFKKHLGSSGIFLAYSAFACGLAVLPLLRQKDATHHTREDP